MNKKICVYTCITGNYDHLNEIANPENNIDYYCFTNNKNITSNTWKIIQLNDSIDNWRLARRIKTIGHPIINNNYEIAVWADANIVWQKPISDFIKKYYKKKTISIFKHFTRTTVHDEAVACLRLHKDNKESIINTLSFLNNQNYPDHNGLYESTVYIKNLKNTQVKETLQTWYNIISNYSPRDQLSFPYAIWKTKLKIDQINLIVWDNEWFYTVKHIANLTITECHFYYGNPDINFDFHKHFSYKYTHDHNTDSYIVNATIPNNTNTIEINPVYQIGYSIKKIIIRPSPHKIKYYGTTIINHDNISCTPYNTIKLSGDYHKNDKLYFSLQMNPIDASDAREIIEKFWEKNNILIAKNKQLLFDNKKILKDNKQLISEINLLQSNLNNIINSKGWRILEKTRKIIPHRKLLK